MNAPRFIPINKGNYSMDSPERERAFHAALAQGWEDGYAAYRAQWETLARTMTVSDYPLLVDLELASVCNLRCPMCYTITPEFKQKVNTKLMDWSLFTRVVDEIAHKVPALRLSLRGEALLHKRFVDAVAYAKAAGIREVSTLTNGGRLTPEFAATVMDAGLDWITISIDGVGAMYESIRKPITFEQILHNVRGIHALKQQRGVRKPVIKVQGIWPALREDPQKYYDTFAPITDLVAYNPLIDYLGNDRDISYVEDFTCPQQYQRLVIGADGLVMKCSNDEENQEIMGDANVETVHQIWHGPKLTAVREQLRRPQGFRDSAVCRKCYLPRAVDESESAAVDGRTFIVKNYVNRLQQIGR